MRGGGDLFALAVAALVPTLVCSLRPKQWLAQRTLTDERNWGDVKTLTAPERWDPCIGPGRVECPAPSTCAKGKCICPVGTTGFPHCRDEVRAVIFFVQLFEKCGTLIERNTALIEKVSPCRMYAHPFLASTVGLVFKRPTHSTPVFQIKWLGLISAAAQTIMKGNTVSAEYAAQWAPANRQTAAVFASVGS
eukprot:SAG31_NODE_1984_length_6740_cov_4.949255_15_plen_192_part_00